MPNSETAFTAWADKTFGPAPDPDIPQTKRFESYFKCWAAARLDLESQLIAVQHSSPPPPTTFAVGAWFGEPIGDLRK